MQSVCRCHPISRKFHQLFGMWMTIDWYWWHSGAESIRFSDRLCHHCESIIRLLKEKRKLHWNRPWDEVGTGRQVVSTRQLTTLETSVKKMWRNRSAIRRSAPLTSGFHFGNKWRKMPCNYITTWFHMCKQLLPASAVAEWPPEMAGWRCMQQ